MTALDLPALAAVGGRVRLINLGLTDLAIPHLATAGELVVLDLPALGAVTCRRCGGPAALQFADRPHRTRTAGEGDSARERAGRPGAGDAPPRRSPRTRSLFVRRTARRLRGRHPPSLGGGGGGWTRSSSSGA